MAWYDKFFKKTNNQLRETVHYSVQRALNQMPKNRAEAGRWEQQFSWYDGIMSRGQFKSKDVMDNLKLIRDLNPDASMSIWNYLRLTNSGHELQAVDRGGEIDQAGSDYLNELAPRVGKIYGGGTDQLVNVLTLSALTTGAVALEVELNEDLNDVVDFHAIDPSRLEFRRQKETGELQLIERTGPTTYTVLNQEQVFYFPIDPDVGDPYGRSPLLPVLQIIFFQVEVLKDLKKVIHHQGYERFDIQVIEQAIMDNLPDDIKHGDPDDVAAYVSNYIDDVQQQFRELEPDDDFFHTDSVKVEMAGGARGGSMDATKVIDIINQQVVTALKQLPVLLGRNEGTTETHGSIQWQIYVSGIENIQRSIKRLLERAYNVALAVQGNQSRARLSFNKIRVTDRKSDAEAADQETRTKIRQVQMGWITNDEAAQATVGHEAAGEPQENVSISRGDASVFREGGQVDGPRHTEMRAGENVKKKYRAEDEDDGPADVIEETWIEDIEALEIEAAEAVRDYLADQLQTYISRLEEASEPPERLSRQRDEPPEDFETWAKMEILHDSEQQLDFMEEFLTDWIQQGVDIAGEATLFELEPDFDFNSKDETLLRWLSNRAHDQAELIQDVTDKDVIMTLWDSVIDGPYSIPKAVENLQESFAFSDARATTIARTEIITAGRSGQYHADVQSGLVIGKEWRSARQERTREGHYEANTQRVAIDEPFLIANGSGQLEQLMFPGDGSLGASADNLINCRCWYKRILEGEKL